MTVRQKILTLSIVMSFLVFSYGAYADLLTLAGISLTFAFLLLSWLLREFPLLKGYSFTALIFAAVSITMYFPQYFVAYGNFKLSMLILPLMQLIMFGMGTELSIKDFVRVVKMPKGVIAGISCHYLIMPGVAFLITRIFSFSDEISAGIILIGCCPSGLASNVMTYLAKANLALSVTLTAVSTILAPIATPLFMQILAGRYVEVNFLEMMWHITEIVILPIGAGLLFNKFLHGKFTFIDRLMPLISMIGIILIVVVITAAGRDSLLMVGGILVIAVFIHNVCGYFFGYWSARMLRMSESDCRTIAIEVGLQNAGLGSSLALAMGKMSTVGLASAIFAPLQNITGSSLALWWRSKSLKEETTLANETVESTSTIHS